jgi:exosortase H (IPTLxxWG-CTERM-specific)
MTGDTDQARAESVKPNRLILRFVLLFALGLVLFQIAFQGYLLESGFFQVYLARTADLASWLMRLFGLDASTSGKFISVRGGGVSIENGCDGLQATMLYVIAVLAFPAPWRAKLWGVVAGVLVILLLNQARIISLLLLQVHVPDFFQTAHVSVWPALIILAALLVWILWARWCTEPPE